MHIPIVRERMFMYNGNIRSFAMELITFRLRGEMNGEEKEETSRGKNY